VAQHQHWPRIGVHCIELRGGPTAGVRTDAAARHLNGRQQVILECAAVVQFLEIKPPARDSGQQRGLPTEPGLLTVAGFQADTLQHVILLGRPPYIVNDAAAKEVALALQGLPGIGEEVELAQPLLEAAQLRFGPLMPRQSLPQR